MATPTVAKTNNNNASVITNSQIHTLHSNKQVDIYVVWNLNYFYPLLFQTLENNEPGKVLTFAKLVAMSFWAVVFRGV